MDPPDQNADRCHAPVITGRRNTGFQRITGRTFSGGTVCADGATVFADGKDEHDLVFEKQELDDLIHQAVRKYAPLFIRRKIALQYEDVHCQILTDEKWLEFVLEQVLSNALKYTRKGKIKIYMDPQSPKTLVIEDTGIGIAPEDLPRVFERGYTGYNGRTDKRSTGIGLYLCKQIMDRLSHTIRIESEMGVGTRVYLGLDTVEL